MFQMCFRWWFKLFKIMNDTTRRPFYFFVHAWWCMLGTIGFCVSQSSIKLDHIIKGFYRSHLLPMIVLISMYFTENNRSYDS